jgi:hypothetical protein
MVAAWAVKGDSTQAATKKTINNRISFSFQESEMFCWHFSRSVLAIESDQKVCQIAIFAT